MSFRLVRCRQCATVFAAEAPAPETLAAAYQAASYDSGVEATMAAATYAAALSARLRPVDRAGRALEIGTGTGIFLGRLREMGFKDVIGVEPSAAAIEAATPEDRPSIREGIFREEDFESGSFSLICCFQTLEHVPDPRALVRSAMNLLVPGGMIALVTHDYRAPISRLLGRRSPIIDIEHMQIFCRESLDHLLAQAGYESIQIETIRNTYPLRYWARLAPLPGRLKPHVVKLLSSAPIDKLQFSVNVGNLLSVGRKPV